MTREMFVKINCTEKEKEEIDAAYDTIDKVREELFLAGKSEEREILEKACIILGNILNGESF